MTNWRAALLVAVFGAGGSSLCANETEFAEQVDLNAARLMAVQHDGQVKTFDSYARSVLKFINASREFRSRDAVHTYLDMMLRPEHYANQNLIYIKKPFTRKEIVASIRARVPVEQREGVISDEEMDRIIDDGLVSTRFLDDPTVVSVMAFLERDVMRTGKEIQAIHSARNLAEPGALARIWRIIPPPGGGPLDPWMVGLQVWDAPSSGVPQDSIHSGIDSRRPEPIPGMSEETRAALSQCWADLQGGWREQDAERVTRALGTMAGGLETIAPSLYPSIGRRTLEHWYYRNHKLTPTWIVYLAAVAFLLMAIVYRWPWTRRVGLGLFAIALCIHTGAIGIRWYLAGRIPNSNMFEAIIASVWFGAVVAVVLEIVFRKSVLRNVSALCASACAVIALMAGNFLPVQLNSDIGVVMPVLDRVIWLYIHTNMVIASYCLIGCAAVSSALYIVFRILKSWVPAESLRVLFDGSGGGPTAALAGGGAMVIAGGPQSDSLADSLADSPADPLAEQRRAGLARICDGATMVFIGLSFVTLWTGIILGAVWADVSWGRPWGWDPKEVFALNTWIIYLILVHVRMKVRDKALWTAILSLVGFCVMLFNWIAVNFVIVGLHSYA